MLEIILDKRVSHNNSRRPIQHNKPVFPKELNDFKYDNDRAQH